MCDVVGAQEKHHFGENTYNIEPCFFGVHHHQQQLSPPDGPDATSTHTLPISTKYSMESNENIVDGSNGDQFFTATFSGGTNGLAEFPPFMRSKSARNSPLASLDGQKAAAVAVSGAATYIPPPPPQAWGAAVGDDGLSGQFGSMSLSSQQHMKEAPVMDRKGRNPGATEFVPKSNNVGLGLTHSASTPSFASYGQPPVSMVTVPPPTATLAVSQVAPGIALSAGTSPLGSPGVSPGGSPLLVRRNKSPVPHLSSAAATNGMINTTLQENVGGTTYFYTQDDLNSQHKGIVMPNFTMYPNILPHVAHMKLKSNMPSFFMPDELKLEILNRHAMTMAQIDPEQNPDIPQEVDNYHCIFPLEPPPPSPLHKSSTFGYPTTCYKATNNKDALTYGLRRIHGFHLVNMKCMGLIDLWKKIQHANIVQLREVFTTKAFGDHSMVFVYDHHPGSETLMSRHFSNPPLPQMNGYSNPYNIDGSARPYSAGKNTLKNPSAGRQQAGLLPESLIWCYVVQLSSALRTIHAHGLACRVMDPTKILLTDKSRIRLNCVGIFDVLSFDARQANPLAMIPRYQQEDLVSLGKVVLALACNSVMGIQREHISTSLELVARNYSADLKNLILYLLTDLNRVKNVNEIMPMIGARFYTQLDAAQLRNDVLENDLSKEVENGRLFRLICKLSVINDRPEFNLDPSWSETGDRYMLKLFRDYLFHQVDESGAPWIDLAHIIQCLNKLEAGVAEKVCLMSRDEQSVLVTTYAELKQCYDSSLAELVNVGSQASQARYS